MGDAIERAPGDGKVVVVNDDAGLTIDTVHWTGPWVAGKPRDRAEASDSRQPPPARAVRAPHRRRFIPLASGVAAAILFLLVPRNEDRSGPAQIGEPVQGALLPSQTTAITATTLPPRNPEPEAPRSSNQEPAGAAAQELAEARILNAQLRADAAKSESSVRQEQGKTAALAQEAATARQELAAGAAQHRQELDKERTQRAGLADALMAAQRDLEAHAEQLRRVRDETGQLRLEDGAKITQLLEQERQRTAALTQEAAAARQESTASMAQQRQALDREGAQRTALAGELTIAQREVAAQAAQLRKASDEAGQLRQADAARTAQSLEQERQKVAALAQAAAARQALTANAAQYRQALDEERAQRAALTAELATARRDVEAQMAQLRKLSDETGQLRQAEAAKATQLLEQERQKAAALVAATRQEQAASAAQQRQALDRERAQRVALATELSAAQREIEAQAARLHEAGKEAGQLKQIGESTVVELRQALQQERDRAAVTAQELASLRPVTVRPAAAEPAAAREISKVPQAVAVVATAQPVAAGGDSTPEAVRLIARAGVLLGQGDIGSARIVLERAAEIGSARASFMLAETYDPRILSTWGTYGTRGEVAKARELYARAQAGGIQEAKDRVEALPREVPGG